MKQYNSDHIIFTTINMKNKPGTQVKEERLISTPQIKRDETDIGKEHSCRGETYKERDTEGILEEEKECVEVERRGCRT